MTNTTPLPTPNAEVVALVARTISALRPLRTSVQEQATAVVVALREAGHLAGPAEVQWGVRPTGWSSVVVRGSEQDALEYAVVNGDDPDWKVVRRRTGPGPWYPAPGS
jgi:hypothetical protein